MTKGWAGDWELTGDTYGKRTLISARFVSYPFDQTIMDAVHEVPGVSWLPETHSNRKVFCQLGAEVAGRAYGQVPVAPFL